MNRKEFAFLEQFEKDDDDGLNEKGAFFVLGGFSDNGTKEILYTGKYFQIYSFSEDVFDKLYYFAKIIWVQGSFLTDNYSFANIDVLFEVITILLTPFLHSREYIYLFVCLLPEEIQDFRRISFKVGCDILDQLPLGFFCIDLLEG